MKKFVSLMLALVMLMSLFACGGGDSGTGSQAPTGNPGGSEFVPTSYDDETVYMNALGEFYEAMQKAQAATDVDEMYALLALAEAKVMESGTLHTYYSDGGTFRMSRIVDKSVPSVMWGSDPDRYETALITNEILTVEDRQELIALWAELAGTGTYEQAVRDYLAEHNYTLKDTMGYWDYTLDPETWDTLTRWTSSVGEPVCLTVEGLAKYDMENVLQPALAETWECSDDGLTWTFHLRPGQVWVDSQGRKVDDIKADDWVASMQHLFDYYGTSAAEVLTPLIVNGQAYADGEITDFTQVGVEAVDDLTLVYHLTQPVNAFESMLTYCGFFAPLCRSYYTSQGGTFGRDTKENGTFGSSPDNIAYCGPYLVTSYTPNNSIVYEENPSYWNAGNLNIRKITWYFNDGQDPLKTYNDFMSGILDRGNLNTSSIQTCREEENFDDYAMTVELTETTRVGYLNLNRQGFALFNDPSTGISEQSHGSTDEIDRQNGVYTSDILDDAARTHSAMNLQNFRLAVSFAWDRAAYNAQSVGEELKEVGIRNSYTPASFVFLSKDVTVDINGTPTTFEEGTYYGAIMQAQIDADGYPIKVWDPDANSGLGSGDGFDGYYNVANAREYMAKAVEELAAMGVEVTADNPIQIDRYYGDYSETGVNQAQALKQSIEGALEGLVQINLIPMHDSKQLNSVSFLIQTGAENCGDYNIGSGWSADYADPSSYLNNLLPYGDGYQAMNLGLW